MAKPFDFSTFQAGLKRYDDSLANVAKSGNYNDLSNKPQNVSVKTVKYTLDTHAIEGGTAYAWSYTPLIPDGYIPVGVVGYDTGGAGCAFKSLYVHPNSNPPIIQVIIENFETSGSQQITPVIYVLYVKSEFIAY